VIPDSPLLLATTGPFGPTVLTFVLFPVLLLGPFVLLAIAARSFLGADPMPRWLTAIFVFGCLAVGFLLWPARVTDRWSGFWGAWRIASISVVVLLPAVLAFELHKSGWFDRAESRPPKRNAKRKRRASDASSPSGGVFHPEDD